MLGGSGRIRSFPRHKTSFGSEKVDFPVLSKACAYSIPCLNSFVFIVVTIDR